MLTELVTRGLRRFDFPGKGKFTEYTCPKEGIVVADVFGFHVKLDLSDPVQRRMYCGTYKPEQFTALSKYIRRGMTFVDSGCNLGYYTLMFASFAHEFAGDPGRVYAFDPDPYAGKRLAETISYNALLNVHFQQVALGGATGEGTIYISRQIGRHQRTMLPHEDFLSIKVPVRRLDDALGEQDITKVDLLRLDVNGYESSVLDGASRYLEEQRISAILCTFNNT